jgi:Ca2+-binding EF-hand superfamily protein
MPHDVKVALSKLAQSAKNKDFSIAQLYTDLDKNKDGRITFSELDDYCLANEISVGLPQESITALFKYMDYDNDGSLSLAELQSMLEAAQANQEDRMKRAFSREFEQKLVDEVSELFDRLDADKSKFLTADELCLASKQQDLMFMLDLEEAKAIVSRIGSDGQINKK